MAKKGSRKEIDIGKFLLQNGERLVLWAGLSVMVLLVAIAALQAWTNTRTDNAAQIAELAKKKESAMRASTITSDKTSIPKDLAEASNPQTLDARDFPLDRPWFRPTSMEDTKWRQP